MVFLKIFLILFLIEILFRIFCLSKYSAIRKTKWKDNYVVSHPFLSFSYKRDSNIFLKKNLDYDLHKNKYFSFYKPLKLNNYGHFGNDFREEKEKKTLRIACLGNSTTANNIADQSKDYCYPDLLLEKMKEKLFLLKTYNNVEVYNFGIGGWVCQDIFIDFFLNVLRTKPDYIVFCHGFVDVPFHMMECFLNDYSHGRKNLGEIIWKIKFSSFIPNLYFWKSYNFLKNKLFGSGNVRDEVIQGIRKQKVKTNLSFDSLKYEYDIIKNIFIICKYYDIKLIISSYPFYNFSNTKISNKIEEGVKIENDNIKKLSDEFNTIFIDHDKIIPKNDLYFLDWVHFTPKGMEVLAENYSDLIIKDIKNKEK